MQNIGYCGNHCTYCFFTACKGCRNGDACYSYAVLEKNKKCPNAVCCTEKGQDGCWDCANVLHCPIGFYSSGENDAKAYALFIQKYGYQTYTKTVERLISKGYDYPKQFKQINDVQKILKLFEEETQYGK